MPIANSGVKPHARPEAFDFTTKGILQEACKLTQFWRWMVQWMVGGMGGWDVYIGGTKGPVMMNFPTK